MKRVQSFVIIMLLALLAGCATEAAVVESEVVIERTVIVTVEVPTIVEVTREVMVTPPPAAEAPSDAVEATPVAPSQQLAPSRTGTEVDTIDYELIAEVWRLLQSQYDGDLPPDDQLTESIIAGLLESLGDEFTRYVPPEVASRLREDMSGSFEGIGAFVRTNDDGKLEIVRPIADQPAAAAGLLPGDQIVGVDGVDIVGMTTDEAINLVRGPRGTTVVLTIERDDEPLFNVSIVRARIEIPIVESEMLDGNVAYVRLTSFSSNATSQLSEALTPLLAQNPVGLVFDLRDNPGGFLDQAVSVSDLFLGDGVVLFERDASGFEETFRSDNGDAAERIPLVVLVNAGSASASEIVAGAVQDNARGTLIGETTFGKGSVQRPNLISNGGELRVTIARWYTPSDRTIDGEGITPDIEVTNPTVDIGGEDDAQLQRAVTFLRDGQ